MPVSNADPIEVDYFESNGLPSELKSLFKLSVLLPSQEFSTYQKWRKVRANSFSFSVSRLHDLHASYYGVVLLSIFF